MAFPVKKYHHSVTDPTGCQFSLSGSFCYDRVKFYIKIQGHESHGIRFQPICAHHLDHLTRTEQIQWYLECITAEEYISYCLAKQVLES